MERDRPGGDRQLTEELRLPARVLPSADMPLAKSVILIICAALTCVGWVFAMSLHWPVTAPELVDVSLPFGLVFVVLGSLLIRQQRRYFGSRGRYWLVIERDRLIVVRPDEQQAAEWRNLTRFAIEEDVRPLMTAEKHVEQCVTVYVTAIDTGPGGGPLKIVADDFAAKLPGSPMERAQKFCAILNDIRRWAMESTAESEALSLRMVSGLALAST
ncbi:hypothetical protein [Dongia deserti]|uniref:hypothetical protein n=1 Tax=Dongia deserti TaxID=2268030 RepID=UPI000E64C7E8|nr:hypothetical protein [Dongia deserti]